jgi:glycosyltransferase involved in cell wall biosynthesis
VTIQDGEDGTPTGGKVSIGLLAHDEEDRIAATLDGLFAQDVFDRFETEVVIVANGCSDATVDVARRALERRRARWSTRGSARVEELTAPGKANAWNEFVHRLSARDAGVLVLLDADIWFLAPDTVSSLVETLARTAKAVVCVDRPIKDAGRARRTWVQRVLGSATPEIDPGDVPLCGQLYCARADALRHVRLPPEIQVDDGFIRALLLTDGFTRPEDRARIVLAEAAHGFESVATFGELLRHERWVVAGSIVNMLLFQRFEREARPGRSAVALMEEWSERDPHWLGAFVQAEVAKRGWRLLPTAWWVRRWSRLRGLGLPRLLSRAPVAAAAALLDALVFLSAIRDVRRGRGYRYWRSA